MKTRLLHLFCIVAISVVSVYDVKAQNKLQQSLASIKDMVKDVPLDKVTFRQSIDILDESKGKLSFVSAQVDEKGKTVNERFEFYISDIDKNTIIRKTSGKKLFISLTINNSQKFIKHFTEDKLDSYANNLEILLASTDTAQELADLFKNTIPLVPTGEKGWNTNVDALNWLKNNITKINSGSGTTEQSFTYGERKDYLSSFTVKKSDQKEVSGEEKYEFNIQDINTKNLLVKVSGPRLSVSVETRAKEPYIKYFKNNEQQSFANDFEIVAEDIDQARNIIAAFSVAVEKSKSVMPDFGTLQKSLEFIAKNTTALTQEKKTISQKISFLTGDGTKSTFTYAEPDSKGKAVEEKYEFYLSDFDANTISFRVSGKKITIIASAKNKAKFIKYFKDNSLQDFQSEIGILTNDIETTRELIEAFKSAIKGSEIKPTVWKNSGEALSYLTGTIKGETIGTDIYKLSLSSVSADPLYLRYVVGKTDVKGAVTEQVYEFYPYMLDPGMVKIASSGKFLNVEVFVSSKKSFVKVFKDSKQQAFDDGIKLMAFDARQSQEMAEAIRFLAGNSKPKDKVWGDKQSVIKFITDNVGDIKGDGNEVKQKISIINDDPCRISFTLTSTDDKGKTTDEIYEFTLTDMNKVMVDLKVSGKKLAVLIPCKNKEKLVKSYRNGVQQAWGSIVEIEAVDIETARNLAEAFKNAITQCEK